MLEINKMLKIDLRAAFWVDFGDDGIFQHILSFFCGCYNFFKEQIWHWILFYELENIKK